MIQNSSENTRSFSGHFIKDNINSIVNSLIKVEDGWVDCGRIYFWKENREVNLVRLNLRNEGHCWEHIIGSNNKILLINKIIG